MKCPKCNTALKIMDTDSTYPDKVDKVLRRKCTKCGEVYYSREELFNKDDILRIWYKRNAASFSSKCSLVILVEGNNRYFSGFSKEGIKTSANATKPFFIILKMSIYLRI